MSDQRAFDRLMHDVCVKYGWCGGLVDGKAVHVTDFIPDDGPVTAAQFVDWLFLADGIDPVAEAERWARQRGYLELSFVEHMGSATVDASLLHWR